MIRLNTADYNSLFLYDTPFLDIRSPAEFNKGSFPTSTNLPLMNDNERSQIGTCYKHHGQYAAISLGYQLVSGKIKTERLTRWLDFAKRNSNGYLYCWRGGLRSQIVQTWLQEVGCEYPRIIGGYKALRQFLIEQQQLILTQTPLLVIAGRTGCAKTILLNQYPCSIDLEALAHHRGSTFGKHPKRQPTQLNFENHLAITLLRRRHYFPNLPLLIEDESHLIGRCALPNILHKKMYTAPRIVIEATLKDRVEHSFHNYILEKFSEWQQILGKTEAFAAFSEDLQQSLNNIRKRLGGLLYQKLNNLMIQALAEHKSGKADLHRAWIEILLTDYYDPMYDHQLAQKNDRIIFRGSREEVRDYLHYQFGFI